VLRSNKAEGEIIVAIGLRNNTPGNETFCEVFRYRRIKHQDICLMFHPVSNSPMQPVRRAPIDLPNYPAFPALISRSPADDPCNNSFTGKGYAAQNVAKPVNRNRST
jgi:hypothetical protein